MSIQSPLKTTSTSLLPHNSANTSSPRTPKIDVHAENRSPYESEAARTSVQSKRSRPKLAVGHGPVSPSNKQARRQEIRYAAEVGEGRGVRAEGSPARDVPRSKGELEPFHLVQQPSPAPRQSSLVIYQADLASYQVPTQIQGLSNRYLARPFRAAAHHQQSSLSPPSAEW